MGGVSEVIFLDNGIPLPLGWFCGMVADSAGLRSR